MLAPSTTAVSLVAKAADTAFLPDSTRSFGEMAKVLSSQGSARDAHLQSIIDAIGRRKTYTSGDKAVGNAGALLSAMAADAEQRRIRRQK